MEIGDLQHAALTLQSYLEEHTEDYRAQLVLLDVQNTASSPVLYQAALWKLYNQHPENRMLCEHLFLYLVEFNDLSGAESVLRHYQLATGRSQEPWFLDYRAILTAVRQDDDEAVRLLKERISREDSWQARFNLAVLLGKNGKSDQAIEQLIEAEHLLPEERNRYYRSRIRSRIGEQYLQLGDAAAARRECEYAIDLDVSNFHAHRILRILERE
jgi:tetratricopeptide (TPR) repeat protein